MINIWIILFRENLVLQGYQDYQVYQERMELQDRRYQSHINLLNQFSQDLVSINTSEKATHIHHCVYFRENQEPLGWGALKEQQEWASRVKKYLFHFSLMLSHV